MYDDPERSRDRSVFVSTGTGEEIDIPDAAFLAVPLVILRRSDDLRPGVEVLLDDLALHAGLLAQSP